jgi:hypothetical protein
MFTHYTARTTSSRDKLVAPIRSFSSRLEHLFLEANRLLSDINNTQEQEFNAVIHYYEIKLMRYRLKSVRHQSEMA